MSLITLNDDQLKEVERMAAAAFSPKDISYQLEVDHSVIREWMNDEESAFFKAYKKGQLTTTLLLRERIFKDANNGSSPAQTLANNLLKDCEIKTMQHE